MTKQLTTYILLEKEHLETEKNLKSKRGGKDECSIQTIGRFLES